MSLAGVGRAFLATLCWSTSPLLLDRLTTDYRLTALEISMWPVLLSLPILTVVIAVQRSGVLRIDPRDLVWYGMAGAAVTLANVTWAASVQINRPATATALGFSAPAFIALGERLVFKTPLRGVQVVAMAVNLTGCCLAVGIRDPAQLIHTPVGLLIGLANGLSFTLYTLLNRSMSPRRARNPLTTLLAIFFISEIGMLLWGLPLEGIRLVQLHLDGFGWSLLIAVTVVATLLPYAFFNSSLRLIPATIASLITTLELPIVAILAFLLLGRTIHGVQWLGMALIVPAVLVMQLSAAGIRIPGTKLSKG